MQNHNIICHISNTLFDKCIEWYHQWMMQPHYGNEQMVGKTLFHSRVNMISWMCHSNTSAHKDTHTHAHTHTELVDVIERTGATFSSLCITSQSVLRLNPPEKQWGSFIKVNSWWELQLSEYYYNSEMSDGVCSHQSVPHVRERQKERRGQEKEPLPPPVTPPPPSSSDWCRSETSYDVTASSVLLHNTPTPPGFPLPRQQGELLCAGGMCAMSHRLLSPTQDTHAAAHTHTHTQALLTSRTQLLSAP